MPIVGRLHLGFALSIALCACGGGNNHPIGGDDTSGGDGGTVDAREQPDATNLIDGAVPSDGADALPPVITVNSPTAGTIVAGDLTLDVTVTDPDGVATVSATIAGTHVITMTSGQSDHWVGHFDTTVLAGLVYPTIVVRADDLSGLSSQLGYEIALDNAAPIASLDPPDIRASKISQGELLCSDQFDPLGGDAPDDGEGVAQLIEFRGRVVDLPNTGTATSNVELPIAGIRSVSLYVLDDTSQPLIVDSNGDGQCDAVNPHIVPEVVPTASNEAAEVELVGVASAGSGFFDPLATFGGANATACTAGTDSNAPDPICPTSDATIAVQSPFSHEPEVYGPPPTSSVSCEGIAFDARASNIADGWACAAIVTTDNLGNTRVSPVMRVCIDADHDHGEGCPDWNTIDTSGAPDCTGTYTAATDTVSSTPCSAPLSFTKPVGDFELIRTDL